MGIRALRRAGGKVAFEADVRINNVDRRTATFDTRKGAELFIEATTAAARNALRASVSALSDGPKVGGRRNFERAKLAAVIVAFRKSSACTHRAKRCLDSVIRFVDEVTVENAEDDWCEQYKADMRKRLTPQGKPYAWATIKEHLVYMRFVCKWWAKRNRVGNPLIGVSTSCIPKNWENKRDRRLQTGEFEQILARINALPTRQAHWRCLITLALETCARQQELVLAQWSEISHSGKLWNIPFEHTKKDTARKVPLSPEAREAIAELRAMKREGDERIFEVFPTPASVSIGFARIVRKTNIKDLTFHDLRHEGISRKVVNCPPGKLPSLMKIVGHKDYQSLMRYSHLLEDDIVGMFG